ncbi:MAG: hypothetical protein IT537_25785, partial [Hyphomicrobiales bacterium]|nr:hypothetical protein [Hyphomicrobiales bacterium]
LVALTALGATALSEQLEDSMIAMLEERMTFLRPVFVGDVVLPQFEVVSVEPKGRSARVEIAASLNNQAGEQVIAGHHRYLLRCRPQPA